LGGELVDWLNINEARFFFNPRFEYDGVYDYGPDVFSDKLPPRLQKGNRFRIFEIYGDFRLFNQLSLRAGRQNFSWGETDVFRLLDRVNPLDNSFGGFLIPLDERRVPITALRATWALGDFPQWEIYNTALEAFIAPDKAVPKGAPGPTPWGVQGAPSPRGFPPTLTSNLAALAAAGHPFRGNQIDRPDVNFKDSRWGARLLWTWQDISFSLAHMSTYPEGATPSLQLNRDGDPVTKLRFPNVQVTGATATAPLSAFHVPILQDLTYTVMRTEWAGFFGEPFFIEKVNFDLNRTLPKRNVIRGVLGLDHNQWFRSLNPANTFFFSGQMFYTDVQGSMGSIRTPIQRRPGHYIDLEHSSFLSTLIANTTYSAGYFFNLAQIQPQITYVYDWKGAWLFQPQLVFLRDPWRFRVEYNWLEGRFTANSAGTNIGLLKDKDNLAFRIDYLL
jgi:hypothetical protein